ncbi:hypothetical protein GCM10027343_36980 [Noviherbaspirillum agri]
MFLERYKAGQHLDVLNSTLDILERRFCDGNGAEGYRRDGPVVCGHFMYGSDDSDLDDARVLEQRNVSGMVTEFLRLIREGMSSP